MAEATWEAQENSRREPAGRTTKTAGPTSGANRSALSLRGRAIEGGESGGSEDEKADAEEGGAEAEVFTMVVSTRPTTPEMPALFVTGTATAEGASIEPDTRSGVTPPTPNV
jgi:hypothetical protein